MGICLLDRSSTILPRQESSCHPARLLTDLSDQRTPLAQSISHKSWAFTQGILRLRGGKLEARAYDEEQLHYSIEQESILNQLFIE